MAIKEATASVDFTPEKDKQSHRREPEDAGPRESIGKAPRESENADSNGHYEIAIRTHGDVVDPGEDIALDFFLTGYGEITGSKLYGFGPDGVFNKSQSSLRF